ncbi:exodeoxyribonuclease VII [Caenimonas koreensis DSM 17982]|uniref:Exodeoxyribonuclease VII n=1 Tax=Caenimonas koreensis DSM 17982 TaxID=1121255 RepID=A0A844B988_9BURK|nr:exodeoxyribonuclease VII small subunit [Caenimonas koreensis]MRD49692.1 exodeoxyribonuclease VII [Caenimonas koreensis DSM 17982]
MTTFKEAFEVLNRHAKALREQEEPNIDDLLRIVNESVAAYRVCEERIAAVDAALQAALKDAATPGNEAR